MEAMRAEDFDHRRLARLLGMLGSSHDGVVLNAARLADRHLREHDMTWPQVLADCAGCFAQGCADGFAAGKRDRRDRTDDTRRTP